VAGSPEIMTGFTEEPPLSPRFHRHPVHSVQFGTGLPASVFSSEGATLHHAVGATEK
jgi:hypothetical protein